MFFHRLFCSLVLLFSCSLVKSSELKIETSKRIEQKFKDFIAYRKIVSPEEDIDTSLKKFIADTISGDILVKEKVTLSEFFKSIEPTYRPSIYLSEDQYKGLIQQQFPSCDKIKILPTIPKEPFYSFEGISSFRKKKKDESCIKGRNHPFYGNFKLPLNHQEDYISGFDPTSLLQPNSINPKYLASLLKPHDKSIAYDGEQVLKATKHEMPSGHYGAVNMNSDLGFINKLETMRNSVITKKTPEGVESPSFTILTQGHAIAGLAALAKMKSKNKNGEEVCLFDTSIIMPMGSWSTKTSRVAVASQGARIWGAEIIKAKKDCKGKFAGGVAIGLNGHRGDFDYENNLGVANIDYHAYFGTPKKFVKMLKDRGLKEIVIVTETHTDTPKKMNMFKLEKLKEDDSPTFNYANADLYEYFKKVKELGVPVRVVSGERRVNKCSPNKVKKVKSSFAK